jgi:hypothetical protein
MTARGVLVFSAAQSRNELRNRCAVMSVRLILRNSIRNATFDSGAFGERPGNTDVANPARWWRPGTATGTIDVVTSG